MTGIAGLRGIQGIIKQGIKLRPGHEYYWESPATVHLPCPARRKSALNFFDAYIDIFLFIIITAWMF